MFSEAVNKESTKKNKQKRAEHPDAAEMPPVDLYFMHAILDFSSISSFLHHS